MKNNSGDECQQHFSGLLTKNLADNTVVSYLDNKTRANFHLFITDSTNSTLSTGKPLEGSLFFHPTKLNVSKNKSPSSCFEPMAVVCVP